MTPEELNLTEENSRLKVENIQLKLLVREISKILVDYQNTTLMAVLAALSAALNVYGHTERR